MSASMSLMIDLVDFGAVTVKKERSNELVALISSGGSSGLIQTCICMSDKPKDGKTWWSKRRQKLVSSYSAYSVLVVDSLSAGPR